MSEAESVVRELFKLFGDGRITETYALMSDSVVLREPGDPQILPWAGTFEGHDGLGRFYDGLSSGLDSVEIHQDSLRYYDVSGGRVLVIGRETGVSSGTKRRYTTSSAWLWEVREGKIERMTAFHDTDAMTRAMQP